MENQSNDMREKLFTPLYPQGTETNSVLQFSSRSPERSSMPNNMPNLQKAQTFIYPGGTSANNSNNNNNNNNNTNPSNTLRPATTINYPHTTLSPQSYQLSPQRPLSPQPSRSVYNDQLEQLSSYPLSSVINHVHLKQALENILIEIISERKDSDNSLKRLWIFQHLIETPCSKCCFIRDDDPDDPQPKNRFRIKSKCLSSHFRVSGNTPFNWLSRDFIRVHAPHSSGVPERKDLREIYYDGFGLFREDMKVQDFIQLSKQLAGRPTSKKRKNRPGDSSSIDSATSASGGGSGGGGSSSGISSSSSSSSGSLSSKLKKMDNNGKDDDESTIVFQSRLILSLKVANRAQIIMYSDRINQYLNKARSPIELPTFRPEQSLKFEIGRREKKEEDEEQRNPFKLYIEDISISRNHLLISFSPEGWTVKDVGSSLGTHHTRSHRENFSISHNKLERNVPIRLEEGDVLTLSEGNASFTVLSCKFNPDEYFLLNQFHS